MSTGSSGDKNFRSGLVGLVGPPNVGKSTLLNTIMGQKLAITSPKPQTTRNRIRAVKTTDTCQMVFLDTPGLHSPRSTLNKSLVRKALAALSEVDVTVLMVEPREYGPEKESYFIGRVAEHSAPVVLAINKIDLIKKGKLLPLIEHYTGLGVFREVIPISALLADGVLRLLGIIEELLPEGEPLFPKEDYTDVTERFLAAEIVREKVFNATSQEVPYATHVEVETFTEDEEKELITIEATVHVERPTQKAIVIGKGGRMLKKIGTDAREELESILGAKVFLDIWVKVSKDWRKKEGRLRSFGLA